MITGDIRALLKRIGDVAWNSTVVRTYDGVAALYILLSYDDLISRCGLATMAHRQEGERENEAVKQSSINDHQGRGDMYSENLSRTIDCHFLPLFNI